MRDLYVYYRVRELDASELEPRVRAMLALVANRHGVACDVKRRPVTRDGMQTWMEIYLAVGTDFDAALDAAVREAGLAELIVGERHAEIFTDLNTCA